MISKIKGDQCYINNNKPLPQNVYERNFEDTDYLFSNLNHSLDSSRHWRCSVEKGALENFAKFTEKHMC